MTAEWLQFWIACPAGCGRKVEVERCEPGCTCGDCAFGIVDRECACSVTTEQVERGAQQRLAQFAAEAAEWDEEATR